MKLDVFNTEAQPDRRPPLGGWAPGNYLGRCIECSEEFIGAKRAIVCSDCAYKKRFAESYARRKRPMPEIKFKLVNGEPTCTGPGCGVNYCCWYPQAGTDNTCIPGLRQQRNRARAKLQTIRALINEEEWNPEFRQVLLAELGDGK